MPSYFLQDMLKISSSLVRQVNTAAFEEVIKKKAATKKVCFLNKQTRGICTNSLSLSGPVCILLNSTYSISPPPGYTCM